MCVNPTRMTTPFRPLPDAAGSAASRPEPQLLGETASLRLWHWPGEGPGTLVIFTPPVGTEPAGPTGWWAQGLAARLGWTALVFAAHDARWYPADEMTALLPAALAALPDAPRVTFGQGMGGYGALRFGQALAARATIALAPAYSIDPADMPGDPRGPRAFDARRGAGIAIRPADLSPAAVIAFDPLLQQDRAQGERLAALPGIRAVPVRRGGAGLAATLIHSGRFGLLLRAALEGEGAQVAALLREARRASPILRAAVATALEKRGHGPWAAALRQPVAATAAPARPARPAREIGRRLAIQARALRLQRQPDAEADVYRQWIGAEPDAIDPRLGLARCLQQAGQLAEAATALDEAIRAGVWSKPLHLMRVRLLRRLDRPEEAIAAAEAAVADLPEDADALAAWGETCLWMSRAAEATAAFQGALAIRPDHQASLLGLALLAPDDTSGAGATLAALIDAMAAGPAAEAEWLHAVDRLSLADRAGSAARMVREALRRHPASVVLALREARLLLGAGQGEEAVDRLRHVVQAAPEDVRSWYGLTEALMQLHRTHDGREAASRAAAAHPADAVIAMRHAGFLNAMGEGAAADREARRAIALDPTSEGGYLVMIDVLRRQARLRDAIRTARAALDAIPDSFPVAMALGRLLLDVKDAGGAAEAFERATTLPRASRQAWIGLAEALAAAGRPEEAEEATRRGLAAMPDARELQTILGELLLGRGEAEAARDALAEAIEQDVESPAVNLALVEALQRQGRRREALHLLQAAVEAAPGHLESEVRLGRLLLDEGRIPDAAALFTRITEAVPEEPNGWVGLSDALRLGKQVKPALEAYRRAVAAGADADTIRRLRYRLFGEYDG
jgi:tetratricopeptide (TPR) repeat protein